MADQGSEPFMVTFANDRSALVVPASRAARPAELVERLGLEAPRPVIVVIGGGDSLDPDLAPQLSELFAQGVLMAAEDTGALVVDGGTESGVMALTGQAVADRGHGTVLVGVAPSALVGYPGRAGDAGAVPLDPNHSHFVLADGAEWGAETRTLFALVDGLVATSANAVGVVVGGGQIARREVLQVVRRGWSIVVITGTGGLADEIDAGIERGDAPTVDETTAPANGAGQGSVDAELAEVLSDGAVALVPLDSEPAVLAGALRRRVGRDQTLESAWELHAWLDTGAVRRQREFRRLRRAILVLGVVATTLAVTEGTLDAHGKLEGHWLRERLLRSILILLPIAMTAAVGASARFRAGNKWVVLRGAAEAVKREICRYRARCGPYGPGAQTAREVRLAERVGTISSSVMKTDVNLGAGGPYDGPLPAPGSVSEGDDGFSVLTPERYVRWRLQEQADWYRRRTVRLERALRRLRWAGMAVGGLGTFLAAVGLEVWIAVTTSVVAALTTYLEYMQLESTLRHFNQASADLETIRRWWIALPDEERLQPRNVNRLVEQSERVMHSESAGWVQDMHDAMTELRRQDDETDDDEGPPPADPRAAGPDRSPTAATSDPSGSNAGSGVRSPNP